LLFGGGIPVSTQLDLPHLSDSKRKLRSGVAPPSRTKIDHCEHVNDFTYARQYLACNQLRRAYRVLVIPSTLSRRPRSQSVLTGGWEVERHWGPTSHINTQSAAVLSRQRGDRGSHPGRLARCDQHAILDSKPSTQKRKKSHDLISVMTEKFVNHGNGNGAKP
jgi:hypothetical protein